GLLLGASTVSVAQPETPVRSAQEASPFPSLVDQFCAACHDSRMKMGGLDLSSIQLEDITQHTDVWEKIVRKLRTRQMPPVGMNRPSESTYKAVVNWLSDVLDKTSEKHPNPGRTETFRRLNRTEYQNAIRDLLALDINAAELLPKEDASHGFDNVTVGELSP